MSYYFDIVGVSPVLDFFYYQEKVESNPHRSKAYIGSYQCTLDSFIQSTELVKEKPDWNWDQVVESIINFWLTQEGEVEKWQKTLTSLPEDNIIVGRVANVQMLREEFRSLLNE